MVLRLCQLKSLLFVALLLVQACTWKSKERSGQEILQSPNPRWFSANEKHSLHDREGKALPHFFYDVSPEFSQDRQTVNVIVTTPQGSKHGYSIDLSSGQRHYTHSYCPQKDVWKEHPGDLTRPPFSVAVIPKTLDQLGEPQKVVVWSNRLGFPFNYQVRYQSVKLVGAYIEQLCPEGNCLGKSNWLSRLVFLGVDANDPSLNDLSTIEGFKKKINWDEGKAYLGNFQGLNSIGDHNYPSTRVGALIEFKDAFTYFSKRSIFLTDDELRKIQKGCHILYDGLWEEVGKEKPEDKQANTVEELKEKLRVIEELKKKNEPVGFSSRFKKFTKKFYKEISTCERFVYHGNVNQDSDEFWFLSYVGLFFRLHRDGYYFDCKNRVWQKNILTDTGSRVYHIQKGIDSCDDESLDQAMGLMPNFLSSLRGEGSFYKFLDYDNHEFGTHQKIYAWVKAPARKFDCRPDPNKEVINKTKPFPEDVSWKKRKVKDINEKLKIII